jgi:hypothetical protein
MEPWQAILFAVAAAALGYSMFQGTLYRRRLAKQDSVTDALADVHAMESSARGIVQKLEIQAYDYSREVEARIDNRLSVLDQLIVDADREIDRLQAMLAESRRSQPADRELTPDELQRCFALSEAGFSAAEIARCLNASLVSVERGLDQWQKPDRRAA